jgi:hypothetical protein
MMQDTCLMPRLVQHLATANIATLIPVVALRIHMKASAEE